MCVWMSNATLHCPAGMGFLAINRIGPMLNGEGGVEAAGIYCRLSSHLAVHPLAGGHRRVRLPLFWQVAVVARAVQLLDRLAALPCLC